MIACLSSIDTNKVKIHLFQVFMMSIERPSKIHATYTGNDLHSLHVVNSQNEKWPIRKTTTAPTTEASTNKLTAKTQHRRIR